MNPVLLHILITLGSFIAMEGVAWFTHKYVMHGILWHLHEDHHNKQTKGFFEHNDYFFLFFALPGSVGIILGSLADFNLYFWIGLGITLYGFAYFTVHDIFIHQRFKICRNSNSKYFKAIRRAHKVHHKHLGKQHGECFGMLLVPSKYFKDHKK